MVPVLSQLCDSVNDGDMAGFLLKDAPEGHPVWRGAGPRLLFEFLPRHRSIYVLRLFHFLFFASVSASCGSAAASHDDKNNICAETLLTDNVCTG